MRSPSTTRSIAFDSDQEEEAIAEYRDQYYWLRMDIGAPDGLGGRVLAAHTVLESERSGTADLPGVGSGTLVDERHFTIDSIQADGWWRLGARSLLQAGAEWRAQSGRYDYADEAEFELLFLTPGAATEPSRTRSISLRPSGNQSGAYVNWRFEPIASIATDLGPALGPRNLVRRGFIEVESACGTDVAATGRHSAEAGLGAIPPDTVH